MVLSLVQYCDNNKVSYEAIRRQIARYKKELEGHVSTQNRTRYLDEYAQDFLDQHRRVQSLILKEDTRALDDLRKGKELAELQLIECQNKLAESQSRVSALLEKIAELNAQIGEVKLIEVKQETALNAAAQEIAGKDKEIENLKTSVKMIESARDHAFEESSRQEEKRKAAEAELEKVKGSYKRTIFGLYKKID